MKRMINVSNNIKLKRIITIIVVFIFVIYISLVLVLSNRKYLYIESIFKSLSSKINTFFIDNCYSVNNNSNNLVSSKINYLEKENESLRKELALKSQKVNYVSSEIVNHIGKTWFDSVVINKGYKDNIKKDQPVVTSDGLAGFVLKTAKNISEVRLLTSYYKKRLVPVIINSSEGEVAGILSNYDVKEELFEITDVTSKTPIYTGDKVVLAGYENNSYKGIYVGEVVKEENSNYGLSRTILVKSSINFNDLLFVSVVVDKWYVFVYYFCFLFY